MAELEYQRGVTHGDQVWFFAPEMGIEEHQIARVISVSQRCGITIQLLDGRKLVIKPSHVVGRLKS